jgi:hypothetical protein
MRAGIRAPPVGAHLVRDRGLPACRGQRVHDAMAPYSHFARLSTRYSVPTATSVMPISTQ